MVFYPIEQLPGISAYQPPTRCHAELASFYKYVTLGPPKTQLIPVTSVITSMPLKITKPFLFLLLFTCVSSTLSAQMITGVWKGKIDKKKVEVKIIQKGDSLAGTSYYYEGANNYQRYSIKGFFDPADNSVVWWDDKLVEEKGKLIFSKGKEPQISIADFNCPGGGKMFLDGKAHPKDKPSDEGTVDLTKISGPNFPDEWDYVIENYTLGTNDPDFIDSVALVAFIPKKTTAPAIRASPPIVKKQRPGMVVIPPLREKTKDPEVEKPAEPIIIKPLTIEEKFIVRKKVFHTDIPVSGDSVELRFYDNAEVDGDSITLFLDGRLLFTHIRLTYKPYVVKIAVADLTDSSELVMVAENLGAIPPNTSSMIAIVGEQRYEANLSSTENTSAVIRLRRQIKPGAKRE